VHRCIGSCAIMKFGFAFACLPTVSAVFGKDTYAMSHPFAYKDFMETYFPTFEFTIQENSTELCNEWVKLCIDDGHTTGCNGPQGNFQVHSVGAYARDSGDKPLEQLELEYTQAMGDMTKYDPYFENHLSFVTEDLAYYTAAFNAGNVPYFASTFVDPETEVEYSSALVQIPGSLAPGAKSLLNVQILGSTSSRRSLGSSSLATAWMHLESAPRKRSSEGKPVLVKSHRSFASSDLVRDVQYFEKVLQGSKTSQGSDVNGEVYTGKMIATDTVFFRYVQPSVQTQGPTSLAAWEAYQVNLHNTCFDSATNNGFDRLADNHWGHELGGLPLDAYILGQQAAGLPYRFYGGLPGGRAVFLYIYGANGWGCQVIGRCSDASLCPSVDPGGYGFCTQGIKGHCKTDGTSTLVV